MEQINLFDPFGKQLITSGTLNSSLRQLNGTISPDDAVRLHDSLENIPRQISAHKTRTVCFRSFEDLDGTSLICNSHYPLNVFNQHSGLLSPVQALEPKSHAYEFSHYDSANVDVTSANRGQPNSKDTAHKPIEPNYQDAFDRSQLMPPPSSAQVPQSGHKRKRSVRQRFTELISGRRKVQHWDSETDSLGSTVFPINGSDYSVDSSSTDSGGGLLSKLRKAHAGLRGLTTAKLGPPQKSRKVVTTNEMNNEVTDSVPIYHHSEDLLEAARRLNFMAGTQELDRLLEELRLTSMQMTSGLPPVNTSHSPRPYTPYTQSSTQKHSQHGSLGHSQTRFHSTRSSSTIGLYGNQDYGTAHSYSGHPSTYTYQKHSSYQTEKRLDGLSRPAHYPTYRSNLSPAPTQRQHTTYTTVLKQRPPAVPKQFSQVHLTIDPECGTTETSNTSASLTNARELTSGREQLLESELNSARQELAQLRRAMSMVEERRRHETTHEYHRSPLSPVHLPTVRSSSVPHPYYQHHNHNNNNNNNLIPSKTATTFYVKFVELISCAIPRIQVHKFHIPTGLTAPGRNMIFADRNSVLGNCLPNHFKFVPRQRDMLKEVLESSQKTRGRTLFRSASYAQRSAFKKAGHHPVLRRTEWNGDFSPVRGISRSGDGQTSQRTLVIPVDCTNSSSIYVVKPVEIERMQNGVQLMEHSPERGSVQPLHPKAELTSVHNCHLDVDSPSSTDADDRHSKSVPINIRSRRMSESLATGEKHSIPIHFHQFVSSKQTNDRSMRKVSDSLEISKGQDIFVPIQADNKPLPKPRKLSLKLTQNRFRNHTDTGDESAGTSHARSSSNSPSVSVKSDQMFTSPSRSHAGSTSLRGAIERNELFTQMEPLFPQFAELHQGPESHFAEVEQVTRSTVSTVESTESQPVSCRRRQISASDPNQKVAANSLFPSEEQIFQARTPIVTSQPLQTARVDTSSTLVNNAQNGQFTGSRGQLSTTSSTIVAPATSSTVIVTPTNNGWKPEPVKRSGAEVVDLTQVQETAPVWYRPNLSRETAISILRQQPPGSFLIRDSTTFKGAFGLAVKVATLPPKVTPKSGKRRNSNVDFQFTTEKVAS
ncbi:hypothetical protein AHF37_03140 [Paragonimus kellicotti]|nr:hypothetical protein AHF37_03140 [Paragonimus kellicotti]